MGLVLAGGLILATSPVAGDFWWSDAPRHALNGILVKDFLVEMPVSNPVQWVVDWYLTWPAITIFFYPPLFYAIAAPFHLVLGDQHWVAQLPVALHHLALGAGIYVLARRWLPAAGALGMSLLAMGAPAVAFWGRQVMLDIPSAAYAVWGTVLLCRWMDGGRSRLFWGAAALLTAGVWIKLTVIYTLGLLPLAALLRHGPRAFRERTVLLAGLVTALAVAPLIVHQLKFGAHNVTNLVGGADLPLPPTNPLSWIWYARELPAIAGIAATALLLLFAFALWGILRKPTHRDAALLLLGWLALAWLFLSFAALKEHRQGLFLVPPVVALGALGLGALLAGRWSGPLGLLLGAVGFAAGLVLSLPPSVVGYAEAAEIAANTTRPGSTVLVSAYRDGTFIYDLHASGRRDIGVARADKLLLEVEARRSLGVRESGLDEAGILALIKRLGVDVVVAQSDYWTDLPVMARLQSVLRSDAFTEIARIAVKTTPTRFKDERELVVYRAKSWSPPVPDPLVVKIQLMHLEIQGLPAQVRMNGNRAHATE